MCSQTSSQKSAQWNGVGAIQDKIVKEWGERPNTRRWEKFAWSSDRKTLAYQFTTVLQFKHIYNTAIYFPKFLFQGCIAFFFFSNSWNFPNLCLWILKLPKVCTSSRDSLFWFFFIFYLCQNLPIQYFTLSPKHSLCPMVPISFVSTWNYPLG